MSSSDVPTGPRIFNARRDIVSSGSHDESVLGSTRTSGPESEETPYSGGRQVTESSEIPLGGAHTEPQGGVEDDAILSPLERIHQKMSQGVAKIGEFRKEGPAQDVSPLESDHSHQAGGIAPTHAVSGRAATPENLKRDFTMGSDTARELHAQLRGEKTREELAKEEMPKNPVSEHEQAVGEIITPGVTPRPPAQEAQETRRAAHTFAQVAEEKRRHRPRLALWAFMGLTIVLWIWEIFAMTRWWGWAGAFIGFVIGLFTLPIFPLLALLQHEPVLAAVIFALLCLDAWLLKKSWSEAKFFLRVIFRKDDDLNGSVYAR